MTTPTGIIGLGNIGGGMCSRLLELGYEVIGCDLSDVACEQARAKGARIVASPSAVAEGCQISLSSLPNPSSVRDAYFGDNGWFQGARPGWTLIETSTIDPHTMRDLAQAADARGITAIDVALSGQPPQAAAGELVFQVGGPDDAVHVGLDVLEALSKKINRTGDIGTAKTVKLVNNLMSLGNIAVAAEAFVLGVRLGMDPERLYEILSVSGGRSAHFNTDFPKVLSNDYRPGFKTGLALKDIGLILDLAKGEGYPTPLASTIAQLYQDAVEHGSTDEHFTSVVKRYEEAADMSVENG